MPVGPRSPGPWVTLGKHFASLSLSPRGSGGEKHDSPPSPIQGSDYKSLPTVSQPLASILSRCLYITVLLKRPASANRLDTPLPSGDSTAGVPAQAPGPHMSQGAPALPSLGKLPSATGPQFPQLRNTDSTHRGCGLTGCLSGLDGATHKALCRG